MIKLITLWLEKLACKHKWGIHSTTNVFEDEYSKIPYKTKQVLVCTECGKIKKIVL